MKQKVTMRSFLYSKEWINMQITIQNIFAFNLITDSVIAIFF